MSVSAGTSTRYWWRHDLTVFARARADPAVPVPSVQLASMLAEGFSTEKGVPPATAASYVPGRAPQAAGLPKVEEEHDW